MLRNPDIFVTVSFSSTEFRLDEPGQYELPPCGMPGSHEAGTCDCDPDLLVLDDEAECDYIDDMDGSSTCIVHCHGSIDTGPRHDPYGVSCELPLAQHRMQGPLCADMAGWADGDIESRWRSCEHESCRFICRRTSFHRGVSPLPGPGPEPQYMEWSGGYAAGDPLPVSNRRTLDSNFREM